VPRMIRTPIRTWRERDRDNTIRRGPSDVLGPVIRRIHVAPLAPGRGTGIPKGLGDPLVDCGIAVIALVADAR
jgi:hypothetical protein